MVSCGRRRPDSPIFSPTVSAATTPRSNSSGQSWRAWTYMVTTADNSLEDRRGDARRCSAAPNRSQRLWRRTIAAAMTGYFARLWRGQLGLAQSCGLNGLFVVLRLAIWVRLDAQRPPASLSALGLFTLLPRLLVFTLGVLSAVGTCRIT